MKNTIRLVKQNEINEIKQYFKAKDNKGLLVELQGRELKTWRLYATEIGKAFKFPAMYQESQNEHVVASYLDWITDLSWFNEVEEYAIIIYDCEHFLINESGNVRQGTYGKYIINKELIISTFVDVVLPWWEYDVEVCVVEGRAKPFNVYLVSQKEINK